jgi:hypothetical protein
MACSVSPGYGSSSLSIDCRQPTAASGASSPEIFFPSLLIGNRERSLNERIDLGQRRGGD